MHRISGLERIVLVIAALMTAVMAPATATGQELGEPDAAMAAAADTPTVDDVAWLAGAWHGEGLGGTFEETWNPPSGGTMVGMFKLLRDDEVVLYEIMRIAAVDGQVALEVKHFSPDFVAWEAKDESIRFRLLEARDGYAAFDGLVFERQDGGTVVASLRMGDPTTGETHTETLTFRRVAAGGGG